MKATHFLLITAALGYAATLSAGEPPTAEELLTAFEKSVEQLDRVQVEWKQAGRAKGNEDRTTIFRDGKRWKKDRWLHRADREGAIREQTLIGDEILEISLQYSAPDGPPSLMPLVTAGRQDIATRGWMQIGPPIVLFGRIFGDGGHPLWKIMRESGSLELLPATEVIDGSETYVVKSQSKFGEHQLWLDPAWGGLPRRIEIKKHPGNLLNGEQLGATTVAAPPAQPDPARRIRLPVRRPRSEYWTRIDKIQIESQQGRFVITGFDERRRTVFTGDKLEPAGAGPKPQEYRFRVVLNPEQFPEDAFKFAVAIPNGTLVSVMDRFPLEYQGPAKPEHEWFDGQIRERTAN